MEQHPCGNPPRHDSRRWILEYTESSTGVLPAYEYAESIGIEIDNLNESMDKGCVLSDLYEDYSCKGPSAPSSSSVSEQEDVSELDSRFAAGH